MCWWTDYKLELGRLNSFFSKFELCVDPWSSEFVLTLTVHLRYFIQHGFHVIVLNFGARSHFTFIVCFITFYVPRALQQKQQHQCIIYCMCCRSLLSENSTILVDSYTECMQIDFEF